MKTILFVSLFSVSCFAQVYHLSDDVYKQVEFTGNFKKFHSLVMDINYDPIADIRDQIEKNTGKKLEFRTPGGTPEAHITVMRPDDYGGIFGYPRALINVLSLDTIHNSFSQYIQEIEFRAICIGRAESDGKEVYYIVVESDGLRQIRQNLDGMSGRSTIYDPNNYTPHITIGYIGGDIYGIQKDESTCIEGSYF